LLLNNCGKLKRKKKLKKKKEEEKTIEILENKKRLSIIVRL
jgi:hypothetical protein